MVDQRRQPHLFPVGGGFDVEFRQYPAQLVGVRAREQLHERCVEPQGRVPRVPQRRRHVQQAVAVRPHQSAVGQRLQGGIQSAGAVTVRRGQEACQIVP